MQLVRQPKQFDVIVTDNLFGDMGAERAAAHAVADRFDLAGDDERGGGIGERDIAIGIPGAAEHFAKRCGVGDTVTALDIGKHARADAEIGG